MSSKADPSGTMASHCTIRKISASSWTMKIGADSTARELNRGNAFGGHCIYIWTTAKTWKLGLRRRAAMHFFT
jgi:hypothetical protein